MRIFHDESCWASSSICFHDESLRINAMIRVFSGTWNMGWAQIRILGIMVRNGSRMEGNFLYKMGDVSKKINLLNNTGEMPLKIHTLKFFSTPLRPESSSPKGCNHYKMVCPAVTVQNDRKMWYGYFWIYGFLWTGWGLKQESDCLTSENRASIGGRAPSSCSSLIGLAIL